MVPLMLLPDETRWKLYLAPTADLRATDRVEWDGGSYEVEGEVERHKARGLLHHYSAVLTRVVGG